MKKEEKRGEEVEGRKGRNEEKRRQRDRRGNGMRK